jgi:hypothetical protein
MGILNAIFAPFIVLYFLMYSFFRYFEVSKDPRLCRVEVTHSGFNSNIIKILRRSEGAATLFLLSGNSENSTNFRTSSPGDLTKAIR